MADQSLLSNDQDKLMFDMTLAWEAVKADQATNPDTLFEAARSAWDALLKGGTWPEEHWLEYIFMVGANSCATAVLNMNRYLEYKDIMNDLYSEVIRLKWIRGGPAGYFDRQEAEGLSRAVGQWQLYQKAAADSDL
jgi:hypothetical protein